MPEGIGILPSAHILPSALQLTLPPADTARRCASESTCAGSATAVHSDVIESRLGDSDLDAAMIAATLHVSERTIYKACAQAGFHLEDHIIGRRLAHACADLEKAALCDESIAALAHRWGFKDASHFSRRFRARYGCSPREWRALPPNRRDRAEKDDNSR